jgi:hypothetical protein
MQTIESIEIISHSSNLDSKNTRRQSKGLTRGLVCRSSESPPVIPTSPLRLVELPTKCQLQAGSLLTAFLTSLVLAYFLSEANWTFTKFLTAHHNLGSSKATPSRLGGFTSKCNKCHEDCFTKLKCTSGYEEDVTQPLVWISHKSLKHHLEVKGRGLKGSRKSIFIGGTSNPQRREGGKLLNYPKKLAIEN